jgi:hypothetical protein
VCAESAIVGVMGYGTIIIVILIVLAFLLVILSNGSDKSEFISIGAILLPAFALLFFYLVPKEYEFT